MKPNQRRPILYKGETYGESIKKRGSGGPKEYKMTFDEARKNLTSSIDKTIDEVRAISSEKKTPNELVVCLRMHSDFTAKSFYPKTIFNPKTISPDISEIGSRMWVKEIQNVPGPEHLEIESGKMFFVRTNESALGKFKEKLAKEEMYHTKAFVKDIRAIVGMSLLQDSEQICGFKSDWEEGNVEAVIHPFNKDQEAAFKYFVALAEKNGLDIGSINYKAYESGITFLSFFANKKIIDSLRGYNPLRTLHPLDFRDFPEVLRSSIPGLPKAPAFTKKSSIIVGVLDGGYKGGNPYLDKYTDYIDPIGGPSEDNLLEHGTCVTSAVLYGALNNYSNADTLPEPPVSVRNFRVYKKGTNAIYNAVDEIEKIIPANNDIKAYNISFGPRGQIEHDSITRFTYALDTLALKHGVQFTVAVGNDGEYVDYNGIQAPSDLVNGFAIGAYSLDSAGKKIKSPYSCIGPGREGNKLKPDLVAFGGCEKVPIQLMSSLGTVRICTLGTSFASPLATPVIARLIAGDPSIDSLVSRALLIHAAAEEKGEGHCVNMGHGPLPEDVSNAISCPEKSYSLIYQTELDAKKYVEYEIPWDDTISGGKVAFRWTIAVLSDVDDLSPDDYTGSTVETFFYPNTRRFKFTKKGEKSITLDIDEDMQRKVQLELDGWQMKPFPVSEPVQKDFLTEKELRDDLKWDTIDCREKSKNINKIKRPKFQVHAQARGENQHKKKVKFVIVLSVKAPSANADIYSKVLSKYPALLPLKVELQTTVPVTV